MTVTLRPMTEPEFATFRVGFVAAWAADLERIADLAAADALAQADARTTADLPLGLATTGHHLFTIARGDDAVGSLWLSLPGHGRAFLDELVVHSGERGRGYGRAAMALAEREARDRGASHLELHVYQHNPRALALYTALGYQATGVMMRKRL